MPYPNLPKEKWNEMDKCVADVKGKVKNPYAVCYASITGKKRIWKRSLGKKPN